MPDLTAERLNQAMPKQALIPATSRSGHYDRSRPTGRLDQATPLASPTNPLADLALSPTQQVSRREPVTTPHEGQTLTGPTATQPLSSAIAPATSRPAEPTSNSSTLAEPSSDVPTPLVAVSLAPSRTRIGTTATVGSRRTAAFQGADRVAIHPHRQLIASANDGWCRGATGYPNAADRDRRDGPQRCAAGGHGHARGIGGGSVRYGQHAHQTRNGGAAPKQCRPDSTARRGTIGITPRRAAAGGIRTKTGHADTGRSTARPMDDGSP